MTINLYKILAAVGEIKNPTTLRRLDARPPVPLQMNWTSALVKS